MEIKEKLTELIGEITEKSIDEVGDLSGKDLFEDLKFDSILIMELVSLIEERFSIELDEEELIESISSFDLLAELIKKRISYVQ